MARCDVRLMTTNRGPVEALLDSQTYWPGWSVAALNTTGRVRSFAGREAAEAATHVRTSNAISRFTTILVQALLPNWPPAAAVL